MSTVWKHSANASFFGVQRNRFVEYQPPRTLAERFALVAQAEGISGIELKYPADFEDVAAVKQLLEQHNLQLSAVNVDTKDAAHFRHGALSGRDPAARREAIRRLTAGMDMAAEFGIDLVTTCPLADGYDYPFQLDFQDAWGFFIDTVKTVAQHRRDVRFCLEYQPHEPHGKILLNNVGKMLHVCAAAAEPNLGANLDIGHAFAAHESPAESAALLHSVGRLFYIHTNDNTGDGGDWDMLSGSIHFWEWLELVHTLKRIDYQGWLGADLVPKDAAGPAVLFQSNVRLIERMTTFLHRVGEAELTAMIQTDGNVAAVFDHLSAELLV